MTGFNWPAFLRSVNQFTSKPFWRHSSMKFRRSNLISWRRLLGPVCSDNLCIFLGSAPSSVHVVCSGVGHWSLLDYTQPSWMQIMGMKRGGWLEWNDEVVSGVVLSRLGQWSLWKILRVGSSTKNGIAPMVRPKKTKMCRRWNHTKKGDLSEYHHKIDVSIHGPHQ
jgi:hypothetical protein